ncbi:ABC transporter permease [Phytohabitans kaempferiae]|uniref:ABC transporter permease n=1 Tax=Phytohabitans kaempferiae TaxID=1620943 RepID=A0ABV6MA92_9ACTN
MGFLAIVLAVWQIGGDDSTRLGLPTLTRTLSSALDLTTTGELPRGLAQSNLAMVAGYLLALLVAVPLGLAMGSLGWVGRLTRPYLVALIAIPMIAILPLIQAIFGLGLGSRIVVVFLFAFVYIALNAEVGARTVPPQLREMAHSFGASRSQVLRTVVLPHAFPVIMAGARLGLGRAITGMVLAELFLVSSGIGSVLSFYRTRFDSGAVFAIILALVLEGVVIMALARMLERRLVRHGDGR